MYIVSKFGGSSLANAAQIRKVIDIIQADTDRQWIVVSAPGKRFTEDSKVTDLLLEWGREAVTGKISSFNPYIPSEATVRERFTQIVDDLGIDFPIRGQLDVMSIAIRENNLDYAASRGEYMMAQVLAAALGYEFIDVTELIHFDENGTLLNTDEEIRKKLTGKKVVIPGFYGSTPNPLIPVKTFSRGGSDLTGAIIARAMKALMYENWTDVSGLLMADPRIVSNPRSIRRVTYQEIRELSYMGAGVFHEEAMFPVKEAGIYTNIRNTNRPNDPGTIISSEYSVDERDFAISGIAGRQNFGIITIQKMMMNQEIGFARRALSVLERHRVSFEHMPGSIDTISIIVDAAQVKGKIDAIMSEIQKDCGADTVEIDFDLALIAVVGQEMVHHPGISSKILSAIASRNINIRTITQGSSENNVIVGVKNEDFNGAVNAIYESFVSSASAV